MPDVKEPTRETRNPCASPMYQFFDDIIQSVDELEQRAIRALQAWQYLIMKATNRQYVKFRDLRELMNYKDNRQIILILGCITFYCQNNDLPALAFVVNKSGFKEDNLSFSGKNLEEYNQELEEIFNFPWYKIVPPAINEFVIQITDIA